jgi:aldose 1-epimerase
MSLEVISLVDAASGATACIAPSLGFNCFSYRPRYGAEHHEVLWQDPEFRGGTARPSRSGMPLLFPFAGRLRGTRFNFDGHDYTVPAGDELGNAIHGFVMGRPWRVVAQLANRATGEFQASLDAPELLNHWPADFRISVEYALLSGVLASRVRIENPSDRPLPFSFGRHDYYRIPLLPTSDMAHCRVGVPARDYWELVQMLPSGRRLPCTGTRALQRGQEIGDRRWDDVFTGLESLPADGVGLAAGEPVVRCWLDDPAGWRLGLSFSATLRECVVFTPPHREAICLEPYSSVPNAFELTARGAPTGLRILEAGETAEYRITTSVEPHSVA